MNTPVVWVVIGITGTVVVVKEVAKILIGYAMSILDHHNPD